MTDLASKIKEALDKLREEPDRRDWRNARWTQEILDAIVKLARDAGQEAYVSRKYKTEAHGNEWLYDLTWLEYSTQERRLTRAVAVLESEWSRSHNDIFYDFQKLLLARADLRVMVFQVYNMDQWHKVVKQFVSEIQDFEQSQANDRYLFSGWSNDLDRFEHTEYVHQPSQPPPR